MTRNRRNHEEGRKQRERLRGFREKTENENVHDTADTVGGGRHNAGNTLPPGARTEKRPSGHDGKAIEQPGRSAGDRDYGRGRIGDRHASDQKLHLYDGKRRQVSAAALRCGFGRGAGGKGRSKEGDDIL